MYYLFWVVLPVVFFFTGLVVGKWIVLLTPVAEGTVWAIATKSHWWGLQPGEAPLLRVTLLLIGIGAASAAAGILIHRLFGPYSLISRQTRSNGRRG